MPNREFRRKNSEFQLPKLESLPDEVFGTHRHPDDPDAVVDNSGRVRGIGGLRVVDASIMPAIPRGNTNIPTIMLAEKVAAEMYTERISGIMPMPL